MGIKKRGNPSANIGAKSAQTLKTDLTKADQCRKQDCQKQV